jgi:hypothetical protein
VPPREVFRCWLLPKAAFSDEQFNLVVDFLTAQIANTVVTKPGGAMKAAQLIYQMLR